MRVVICGVDPGSRTGWAIGVVNESELRIVEAGYWDIAPRRGESPGVRYLRLQGHLEEIASAFPDLTVVAYEQAHQRGGAATEYAVGCSTRIQSWCADRKVQHVAVHSATLKKHATGNGRAEKSDMLRRAVDLVPEQLKEAVRSCHDTADAVHLVSVCAARLFAAAVR